MVLEVYHYYLSFVGNERRFKNCAAKMKPVWNICYPHLLLFFWFEERKQKQRPKDVGMDIVIG